MLLFYPLSIHATIGAVIFRALAGLVRVRVDVGKRDRDWDAVHAVVLQGSVTCFRAGT